MKLALRVWFGRSYTVEEIQAMSNVELGRIIHFQRWTPYIQSFMFFVALFCMLLILAGHSLLFFIPAFLALIIFLKQAEGL